MGEAIGEVLAFGIGVALSPLAVIAVVVMLDAQDGRGGALAFLAAWAAGLATVGALAVLLADGVDASDGGAPATWVSVLKLVLALLLLVVAARQWRARPGAGEQPELPGWMSGLDDITPARAAGLALLFACVKPKNLLLTLGAATLSAVRTWMEHENTTIIVVLCVVLAGKLAGDGISGLTG